MGLYGYSKSVLNYNEEFSLNECCCGHLTTINTPFTTSIHFKTCYSKHGKKCSGKYITWKNFSFIKHTWVHNFLQACEYIYHGSVIFKAFLADIYFLNVNFKKNMIYSHAHEKILSIRKSAEFI